MLLKERQRNQISRSHSRIHLFHQSLPQVREIFQNLMMKQNYLSMVRILIPQSLLILQMIVLQRLYMTKFYIVLSHKMVKRVFYEWNNLAKKGLVTISFLILRYKNNHGIARLSHCCLVFTIAVRLRKNGSTIIYTDRTLEGFRERWKGFEPFQR